MLPDDPFAAMKMKQYKALKSPEKKKKTVYDRLAKAIVIKTEERAEDLPNKEKTRRQQTIINPKSLVPEPTLI